LDAGKVSAVGSTYAIEDSNEATLGDHGDDGQLHVGERRAQPSEVFLQVFTARCRTRQVIVVIRGDDFIEHGVIAGFYGCEESAYRALVEFYFIGLLHRATSVRGKTSGCFISVSNAR